VRDQSLGPNRRFCGQGGGAVFLFAAARTVGSFVHFAYPGTRYGTFTPPGAPGLLFHANVRTGSESRPFLYVAIATTLIYPRQKRVDPMVVDRQKVRGFIEGVSLAIFAERIPGINN
jgi:hypothetical protein